MKNLPLFTIITLVFTVILYSCTTEKMGIDKISSSNNITAQSIEFVGIEHNVMLEGAYEFLKSNYNEENFKKSSGEEKKRILENYFIAQIDHNSEYSNNSKKVAVNSITRIFDHAKTTSKYSTYSQSSSIELTPLQRKYLESLNALLGQISAETDNNLIDDIIILENEIEKDINLNEEQLITLFSATQTAKHSYIYWKENWEKWVELNGSQKNFHLNKQDEEEDDGHNGCDCESVENVAKADVAGAVGGAAYAWAVNILPGAGQVAYGGAIVGTAAAGSAVAAVYEILEW